MTIRLSLLLGISTSYIVLLAPSVLAMAVQWTAGDGGNDHWYDAVLRPNGITWAQAQTEAQAVGGYLATIGSAEENEFVFSLVQGRPEFFQPTDLNPGNGPWLGGLQPDGSPEPAGNWQWVTGEPFNYTAWHYDEPNNCCLEFGCGAEDRLHYHVDIWPRWNDVPGNAHLSGYIMEIPEPATLSLLALGLLGLGFNGRRRNG